MPVTGKMVLSLKRGFNPNLAVWLPVVAAFIGFYLLSRSDFLLFHSLIELFGIVVAFSVFVIAWNSRRFLDNHYLLLVGIGFLFVSVLNVFHTLSYRGMGIFQDFEPTNLAAQFWIAARYLQSLILLIAPIFIVRRLKIGATFAGFTLATAVVIWSILVWETFPVTFAPDTGLTAFKVVSEFVISGILAVGIWLIHRNRSHFSGSVAGYLIVAMGMNIGSEMAFTLYTDAYGITNALGHLFLVISYYFIYKSLIETGISRPFELMFRNLKESEQKLRIVTDFTYTWEYWVSPDREFLFMSPSCERLTGYQREEFFRNPDLFVNIIHEDDADRVLAHLRNPDLSNIDDSEMEYRIRHRDGRVVWLGHVCRPVFDQEGKYSGQRASNRDITPQVEHREKLRRLAEEWQSTFDSIEDAVILLDNRHRIIRANRAFSVFFNFSPEEAVGRYCHDIIHGKDRPHHLCPHARTMNERTTVSEELFEPRLDRYIEATTSPILDQNGTCVGSVHIIKDIHERKVAERERENLLRQVENQRHLLQHTLEQLPSGVVVRDPDGNLLMANSEIIRIFGPLPENISDFDTLNCFQTDGRRYTGNDWPMSRTVITGETVVGEEIKIVRDREEPMTVLGATAPVRNDANDIIANVGVFSDITKRKQAEELLKNLTGELENRIRERTRELVAAHDKLLEQLELRAGAEESLRSLSNRLLNVQEEEKRAVARELHDQTGQSLTVLKLLLGKADRTAPEEMRPVLSEISDMVTQIIRQVRNLSLSLRPAVLDDLGLIPALEWLFRQLNDQTELKVTFDHADLPPIPPDVAIGIFRIVQEALTNVLRYADTREAEVKLALKDETVLLHIADRGKGFTGSSISTGRSTGISAMRERATLLGGQFAIVSKPGQGTIVSVSIPFRKISVPENR